MPTRLLLLNQKRLPLLMQKGLLHWCCKGSHLPPGAYWPCALVTWSSANSGSQCHWPWLPATRPVAASQDKLGYSNELFRKELAFYTLGVGQPYADWLLQTAFWTMICWSVAASDVITSCYRCKSAAARKRFLRLATITIAVLYRLMSKVKKRVIILILYLLWYAWFLGNTRPRQVVHSESSRCDIYNHPRVTDNERLTLDSRCWENVSHRTWAYRDLMLCHEGEISIVTVRVLWADKSSLRLNRTNSRCVWRDNNWN